MSELLSHPVPAVVFLLGILIFVHELGHFLVGKACGLGVEIFSIGFGPKIISFRKDGTDYRICWVPLGGFVKFAGSLPSEEVPDRFKGQELYKADRWKKALMIAAGPGGNLLLAAVLYAILGMAGIKSPSAVIGQVSPGSAADKAGLVSGDKITKIADVDVKRWMDIQKVVSASADKKVDISLLRRGKKLELTATPTRVEQIDIFGKKRFIGRLGVAYGFLPPVLSVTSFEGVAAKVGLRNGDEIERVSFDNKDYKISAWHEFLDSLLDAYNMKTKSINVYVKNKESSTIMYTLDVSSWATLVGSRSKQKLKKELSLALGLTDSQLTVAKVKSDLLSKVKPNDRILAFNGIRLKDIYELSELLEKNRSPKVKLTLQRNGAELTVDVDLNPVEVQKPSGVETMYSMPITFLGSSVNPEPYIEKYTNIGSAFLFGIRSTTEKSAELVGTIWGLVTGQVPLKALGGPMLIAKVAGESAKRGWEAFFLTMALISINLGMINLFPIPVLDGGQLVMVAVETVFGRPLSQEAIENYQKIGFVLVMSLMVLATYNDLSRFWKSFVKEIAGLF